jgi:glutamate synthase (NADPH/NADH) large chain
MHFMLVPMIESQVDPIGSMGNDSALACLSDKPRLIYDYFKQLFARSLILRSIRFARM